MMSVKDKLLLMRIKLGIYMLIALFVSHSLAFNVLAEIWPLARMPMFSSGYQTLCPTISRLQLVIADASGEEQEVPIASLFNHMTMDYEYLVGVNLISGALSQHDGYQAQLFERVQRLYPETNVDFLRVWLENWFVTPETFTQVYEQSEPDERIFIGEIAQNGTIGPNIIPIENEDCRYQFYYEDFMEE